MMLRGPVRKKIMTLHPKSRVPLLFFRLMAIRKQQRSGRSGERRAATCFLSKEREAVVAFHFSFKESNAGCLLSGSLACAAQCLLLVDQRAAEPLHTVEAIQWG